MFYNPFFDLLSLFRYFFFSAPMFLLLPSAALNAETTQIKYFQTGVRYQYNIELLDLIMDQSVEKFGGYRLVPATKNMTLGRGQYFLEKGDKINLGFFAANKERERRFRAIRVPILRGLLGYRVALINRQDIEKFKDIKTLKTLKENFTAGFGSQWADMAILRYNGIPVIGTPKYDSLFKMLSAGRFDYFPRGISEILSEIETRKSDFPDLTLEKYIALYYPYPVYFFVSKNDSKLAERIEYGFEKALENGSFKTLFLFWYKDLIKKINLEERIIFRLENPTLSPGTPQPDTSWWLHNANQQNYIERGPDN